MNLGAFDARRSSDRTLICPFPGMGVLEPTEARAIELRPQRGMRAMRVTVAVGVERVWPRGVRGLLARWTERLATWWYRLRGQHTGVDHPSIAHHLRCLDMHVDEHRIYVEKRAFDQTTLVTFALGNDERGVVVHAGQTLSLVLRNANPEAWRLRFAGAVFGLAIDRTSQN